MRTCTEVWVILAALATVPLIIAQERGYSDDLVVAGDWVAWAGFVTEYILLFFLAPDRHYYVRRNWTGLTVILVSFPLLPPLLGLARLLRLARLLFVTWRGTQAVAVVFGRRGLVYAFFITGILVLAGSAVFVVMEPDTPLLRVRA